MIAFYKSDGCRSYQQTNSIKAMKEEKRTDGQQNNNLLSVRTERTLVVGQPIKIAKNINTKLLRVCILHNHGKSLTKRPDN